MGLKFTISVVLILKISSSFATANFRSMRYVPKKNIIASNIDYQRRVLAYSE